MQSDKTWTGGRGAEGVSGPLERDAVNLRHRSAEHAVWRQSDARLSVSIFIFLFIFKFFFDRETRRGSCHRYHLLPANKKLNFFLKII